jgi:hypothetical protein
MYSTKQGTTFREHPRGVKVTNAQPVPGNPANRRFKLLLKDSYM